MKTRDTIKTKPSLSLKTICRWMMEDGRYPIYEKTHLLFGIDDNLAVLEYDEGVLSVRLFFSIEEEYYDMFLKASNSTMMESLAVKPVILDDKKDIMFSCESICYTKTDLKRFLPRMVDLLKKAVSIHKAEMKSLVIADGLNSGILITADEGLQTKSNMPVS